MPDFKQLKIGTDIYTVKDETARNAANSAAGQALDAYETALRAENAVEAATEAAQQATEAAQSASALAQGAQDSVDALTQTVMSVQQITGITHSDSLGTITAATCYKNNNVCTIEVKFRNATNPTAVGKIGCTSVLHGIPVPLVPAYGHGSYPVSGTYQFAEGTINESGEFNAKAITQLSSTSVDRRIEFTYVCGAGFTP